MGKLRAGIASGAYVGVEGHYCLLSVNCYSYTQQAFAYSIADCCNDDDERKWISRAKAPRLRI